MTEGLYTGFILITTLIEIFETNLMICDEWHTLLCNFVDKFATNMVSP